MIISTSSAKRPQRYNTVAMAPNPQNFSDSSAAQARQSPNFSWRNMAPVVVGLSLLGVLALTLNGNEDDKTIKAQMTQCGNDIKVMEAHEQRETLMYKGLTTAQLLSSEACNAIMKSSGQSAPRLIKADMLSPEDGISGAVTKSAYVYTVKHPKNRSSVLATKDYLGGWNMRPEGTQELIRLLANGQNPQN